jgi:hypothetical protein
MNIFLDRKLVSQSARNEKAMLKARIADAKTKRDP